MPPAFTVTGLVSAAPGWAASPIASVPLEIVVGGAGALQDQRVGRPHFRAAYRVAIEHRAGLQNQRIGAGRFLKQHCRTVSPGDGPGIGHGVVAADGA
jgi:hypothetical protein